MTVLATNSTEEAMSGTTITIGPKHEGRRRRQDAAERWLRVASPIVILLLWEVIVRSKLLDSRFFPAPSQILDTFWQVLEDGSLLSNVGISLRRAGIGFLLGVIPAIIIGLIMGTVRMVRAALWPIVGALYPIPKIAILPLLILMFGLGESSKWVFIAIGAFFPVLINTVAGVESIPQVYREVATNFRASRFRNLTTIAIPGAAPMIITGLRLAWGQALLLVVAAEFIAARSGIGYWIWEAWQGFQISRMYVGLVAVSAVGYFSFLLIDWVAPRFLPWQRSNRR